jgi:hypothetical protein
MKKIMYVLFMCLVLVSCASVKKTGNPDVMLANIDSFQIETMTFGFDKLLSKEIDQKTAFVFLDPRADRIWLQFTYDSNKNLLFFDKACRDAYRAAVQKYLEEYESKTLLREKMKTVKVYGSVDAFHRWGLFSLNGAAVQNTQFGYRFVENTPYFTMTLPETPNLLFGGNTGSKVRASVHIVLYFTKVQAIALADLIAQENLLTLLSMQDVPEAGIEAPDVY